MRYCSPDYSLVIMVGLLAFMAGLAIGKLWGDRTRRIRITRRRRRANV